ncbi:hypothetical protein N8482_02510 [Chitinophagales bacterium]|nr:hypothetical protein [Chitinophagales bacterium]
MEDLVKKVLYTGVGMAASMTDKVQQTVNDLVDGEKINEDEGRKIVNEFTKTAEGKKGEFEALVKDLIERAVAKMDLVKRTDLDTLVKKVAKLEKELKK